MLWMWPGNPVIFGFSIDSKVACGSRRCLEFKSGEISIFNSLKYYSQNWQLTQKIRRRSRLRREALRRCHSAEHSWWAVGDSPTILPALKIKVYCLRMWMLNQTIHPTIWVTMNSRTAWTLMATSSIWQAINFPCLVPSIRVSSTSTLTYLRY